MLPFSDKLREMAALENVPEALEYLKRQPAYEDLFSDVDDQSLQKGDIKTLTSWEMLPF